MITATGQHITGPTTEQGRLVIGSLTEIGEYSSKTSVSASFSFDLSTGVNFTDIIVITGTFVSNASSSILLVDRAFDKIFLENNATAVSFNSVFVEKTLGLFSTAIAHEIGFTAVFGNIGTVGLEVDSHLVLAGSQEVFGSFTSNISTNIVLNNSIVQGSFTLAVDAEAYFSAYLVITGTFGFSQDSILSFLGYPVNTSSDIGQVTSSKPVLVMNIDSQGVSEYTYYDFNSFFELNGKYYGCASSGIFALEGASDNSVQIAQAVAKTAISDFNTQKMKSVRDGYAYIRSSGDMLISVTTNEQIERNNYPLYYDGVDGIHRRRVKTAQGLRGTSWQVSIKNDSGADFTIKRVDIIPVELDRSI